MIHKLHDKKSIARKRRLIRYGIATVVFVVISSIGLLSIFGKIFIPLSKPFWYARTSVAEKVTQASVVVRTKSSVFSENNRLVQDNTNLHNAMVDYGVLKKENDDLKVLLSRTLNPSSYILASVLAKPNSSPYDTIIIDGGADAHMSEGQHVYADIKMPIGEISKVYPTAALVMLYSNPGQITEGMLDGSNANVELIGRGGGNFEMSLPIDVVAEKGSAVVIPGISEEIIAFVDATISSPTDPIKKVLLHSSSNIQNLKWVQVKK